jgi:5-methylthioribose kinase
VSDPAQLDIEQRDQLLAYLRQTGRIAGDELPLVRNLAGGVSNRTVLVQRESGAAWVLKQALARLRVAVDWYSSPARVHREALGLQWLAEIAPRDTIPAFVFEDESVHLLAMRAVPEPHENWKQLLLRGGLASDHVAQFGELLGTIHRRSHARREVLAPLFADQSFFESLRLEPYYSYTASRVPAAAPFLNALIADTRAQHLSLVHGDYSPKNILVYGGRLILLDHEVIHFGDPAFDVGFSLTHLLSKAHYLVGQRLAFSQAAQHYWEVYRAALGQVPWCGAELEERAARHTLACLLARVAGRSPLEYLDAAARAHQQQIVLDLLSGAPRTVPDLIDRFVKSL